MSTTKSFFEYVKEQLSAIDGVGYRAMMGEYLIYYKGKVVGGLYDDRLLVKSTPCSLDLLPSAPVEIPYDGAKPMIMITEVEDSSFIEKVFAIIWQGLK